MIRPNAIFSDTFDSGTLSAWSARIGAVARHEPAAGIPTGGGNVRLVGDGGGRNAPAYVTDNTPSDETTYRAQFSFNPNTLTTGAGTTAWADGLRGADAPRAGVRGAVPPRRHRGDGRTAADRHEPQHAFGTTTGTALNLAAGAHTVRVDWVPGDGRVADACRVDGALRDTLHRQQHRHRDAGPVGSPGRHRRTHHHVDHGGHGLVRQLRLDPEQHPLIRSHLVPGSPARDPGRQHRRAVRMSTTTAVPPVQPPARRPRRPVPRTGRRRVGPRTALAVVAVLVVAVLGLLGARALRGRRRRPGPTRPAVRRDGDRPRRADLAGRGRRRRRPRDPQLRRPRRRQGDRGSRPTRKHPPVLRSEARDGSTNRVSIMRQGHINRAGATYYFVYQNTGGALRAGEDVTIEYGGLRLEHVPVL